jgi:hypothetical protein
VRLAPRAGDSFSNRKESQMIENLFQLGEGVEHRGNVGLQPDRTPDRARVPR